MHRFSRKHADQGELPLADPAPWKSRLDHFWNHSGAKGTLTLFDWLGVSPAVAVVLAVLMALGMFAGGEAVERWIKRRAEVKS
jgi:hypothetical protein